MKYEETKFSNKSRQYLQGIHPELIRVMELALNYSHVPFAITEGLRSIERQRSLVAEGKSQTMNSRHLTGHAVDVVALPAGVVSWEGAFYQNIADAVAQAAQECLVAVEWGGNWNTLKDGAHFQLSQHDYPA
ncbi:M15 family metallopeptidase [Edaphovirga cremea]|uniref:M15 family metallopeptidase n=1 Tax=Edaphovirga cremea TaxID=2267246 RepID=UPI000DEF9A20|nr:M15 family metallopeptidase [Edaphovirga cremea]